MSETYDRYAKGMVEYKEEDIDSTPELDRYQYSLFADDVKGKVLELGAGAGRISRLTAQNRNLTEMVVSEPSDHFFRLLSKQSFAIPSIEFVQSESSELAAKYPEHFDTVYSVDVMEHIEDDKAYLNQCFELLKPGGACIVLVPALQYLYSSLDKSIGHYRRYDKKMVRRLVEGTGFQIEKMSYNNFVGMLASLYFIKFRKLDYQTPTNKKQFVFLARIYSKYFIPFIRWSEKILPVPVGLNLTVVLRKPKS